MTSDEWLGQFTCHIFMAEIKDKLPDNVSGKFFVDRQCIDCDVCRDTAPTNFTRNDENGYSYVYKQPQTTEELALCEEAEQSCPVEAIGEIAARSAAYLSVISKITANL